MRPLGIPAVLQDWCGECNTVQSLLAYACRSWDERIALAMQSEFIFRVEGTGVLSVEDVILTAVDVLTSKLRNLQQALPEVVEEEDK